MEVKNAIEPNEEQMQGFLEGDTESPIEMDFFLLKNTHDGIVSFKVSVFFILGSPLSILTIAEFVVPKSIP